MGWVFVVRGARLQGFISPSPSPVGRSEPSCWRGPGSPWPRHSRGWSRRSCRSACTMRRLVLPVADGPC
jgi:hypothetical protein